MEVIHHLIDLIIHIDTHLGDLVRNYQSWTYLILFLIVFCETGLVVTPILPGDSLLFATGTIAALPESNLNIALIALLLCIAALSGDITNYSIGRAIGGKAFSGNFKLLNKKYLDKTQQFYEKHGGKTIIIARFVPIVRTFAPFVAGVGTMRFARFMSFSVVGALVWVNLFCFAGYLFGNIPAVKKHFTVVIFAIIVLSLLPPVIEFLKHKMKKNA